MVYLTAALLAMTAAAFAALLVSGRRQGCRSAVVVIWDDDCDEGAVLALLRDEQAAGCRGRRIILVSSSAFDERARLLAGKYSGIRLVCSPQLAGLISENIPSGEDTDERY